MSLLPHIRITKKYTVRMLDVASWRKTDTCGTKIQITILYSVLQVEEISELWKFKYMEFLTKLQIKARLVIFFISLKALGISDHNPVITMIEF